MEISYKDLKRELNIKVIDVDGYKNAISLNAKDMRLFKTKDKYIFALLNHNNDIERLEFLKEEVDKIKNREYIYKSTSNKEDSIGVLIDNKCWDYIEDSVNNEKDYNDDNIYTYNNDMIADIKDIATKTGKINIKCSACVYLNEGKDIDKLDKYFNKKEFFNLDLGVENFKISLLKADSFKIIYDIFKKYDSLDGIKLEKGMLYVDLKDFVPNHLNDIHINTHLGNITYDEYLKLKNILNSYIKRDNGYFTLEYNTNLKDVSIIKGDEQPFDGRE